MELYRVALEMLLERRDVDRRIAGTERLPLKEKQLLLRDFAYWLVLNNYVDADQATAVDRVAQKLASMPRVDDDPAAVFRYLLERSGFVRRSSGGSTSSTEPSRSTSPQTRRSGRSMLVC
jgi:hypothetical protein